MLGRGAQIWRPWRDLRRYRRLAPERRSIVVYAEAAFDWTHLGPVVRELTEHYDRPVALLTSSPDDPVLGHDRARTPAFFVGHGLARIMTFMYLRADVVLMTMPDLHSMEVKRSRVEDIHYVYLFHSMVSTHMIYRTTAFDHFDSVLCVGPHHVREIRRREELFGLPPKRLVEHGYGRLDHLRAVAARQGPASPPDGADVTRILLAPSWGEHGLLETMGERVVDALLRDPCHHVTVRPHPRTRDRCPAVMDALARRCATTPRCVLETDIAGVDSLAAADVMVTDWSGAAIEFAFGFERPVLFVDTPRKVNNSDYGQLGLEPVEAALRPRLGAIVAPTALDTMGDIVLALRRDRAAIVERIRIARAEIVFNPGRSVAVAAEYVAAVADGRRATGDRT